jgi:hypothetical protein
VGLQGLLAFKHSCEGGELVEKIRMRRYCSEQDARIIMTRIADAIGEFVCQTSNSV